MDWYLFALCGLCIVGGGALGLVIGCISAANRISELDEENFDLRKRITSLEVSR